MDAPDPWVARIGEPRDDGGPGLVFSGGTPAHAGDEHGAAWVDGIPHPGGVPPPRRSPGAWAVLRAYRTGGARGVAALRGAFAFILWDGAAGEVVVGRDVLGQHPLFIAESPAGAWVSPSLPALLALPGVGRELDRRVLAEHLLGRWSDPCATYFATVRRPPPGRLLRRPPGASTAWRMEPDARDDPPELPAAVDDGGSGSVAERLGEALVRATRRALDRQPGAVFSSAGLDSAAVAWAASRVAREEGTRPPVALAIEEDLAIQRGLAERLGMPLVVVPRVLAPAADGAWLAALVAGVRAAASPLFNLWSPAMERLARHGHEAGCRVLLSGAGGDEWLGPDPAALPRLLARGRLLAVSALLRAHHRDGGAAGRLFWRAGVRPVLGAGLGRRRVVPAGALPSWFGRDPELRARLGRSCSFPAPEAPSLRPEAREILCRPLLPHWREQMARIGAREGLPLRHVLWDSEVVATAGALAVGELCQGGWSKAPLRALLAGRLSDLHVGARGNPTLADGLGARMAAEARVRWGRRPTVPRLVALGLVDSDAAREHLARLLASDRPQTIYDAWYMLITEEWVAAHC